MSHRPHIVKKKNYRVHVQQYYTILEQHHEQGDKKAFYALFSRIIPQLRNYIKTRLQELVHEGHFPHNFYEVDDFVDDLFIAVYENFKNLHNEEDFYMFLFSEIDTLLQEVQTREDKHHQSVENIEPYLRSERNSLRERFTAELDGDLIMKEELNDISYDLIFKYLQPIAGEANSTEIDDKIDREQRAKSRNASIDALLSKFPQEHRNVATLYIHFHLTAPEIVRVTKLPRIEVEHILDGIKHNLRRDFFNL